MGRGHSSPTAEDFFRTDTVAGLSWRAEKLKKSRGQKSFWEEGSSTLFSHFENTLQHTSVLRLHLFSIALQSFYGNVPPGLHSLCITECLIWFLQSSIMNWQNRLVCCPHILSISLQLWFCSPVISQDWQLEGLDFPLWKLLCSQATGPSNDGKLCLWHVNYGAKYSRAAVYHFSRLNISLIRGFVRCIRFLLTHTISHNSTNKILKYTIIQIYKIYTLANIFFEFTLQEMLLYKVIHFFLSS